MKICWDNLESVKYDKENGIFLRQYRSGNRIKYEKMMYVEACVGCGEPFLARLMKDRKQILCSKQCRPQYALKRLLRNYSKNDRVYRQGYSIGYAAGYAACKEVQDASI